MKVRHKIKHYIVGEVFQETPTHYLVYTDYAESDSPLHAYPKKHYEPLPAEHWQDVTEEVDANPPDCTGWLDPHRYHEHHGVAAIYAYHGYRLRKVLVYPLGQPTEIKKWAFLVERRGEP